MNLCIDQGNSSLKIGVFNNNDLVLSKIYPTFEQDDINVIFNHYPIYSCIISSVKDENKELNEFLADRVSQFITLTHKTPIPIDNRYKSPETLGKDRLAAVIGATTLKPITNLLVIDAGTAITYDFIDCNGVYWGGNIAPGIELRFRALYEFTAKLPLIEPQLEVPFLGNDTNSAILAGVMHGVEFEINGYIKTLKIKYPKLSIFLTGGSTFYVHTKLKSPIFAEKNLVLIGLNSILQYNVQK